ncbi:MAG TPA: DUF5317 domain-containing protein [Clostridia bacterium]|nr:DUF5317 domain-containing protein [Clostridia bacterium]
MFILYSVVFGVLLGFALGGRLANLASIEFRWPWLAIAGFAVQVALFSPSVGDSVGAAGPPIYVASTGAVLVAVLRNVRVPGLALVAVGAASNLAAIVANGGLMPTTPAAQAVAGLSIEEGFTNSIVVANPGLEPLTDIYALPAWVPFANVFSIGDVLIALGVVMVIVIGMRSAPAAVREGAVPVSRA